MDLILDATVAVESDTASDIESGNTIDVTNPITNNLEVTFDSNQFSIVGDDMVVVTRYDDAPQWLRDTIDNIVNVKTAVAVGDLNTVKEALDVMLEELEAAKNTYQLSIVSSDDIDSRILTAITTANSALQEADATILEIAQTAVTPSEAGAIAANAISASLSANGQIGSTLSNIQEAMTTLENTMASDISFLESVMEGEIEGNASAMETIRTYVGIDEAGASIGTGLSAYLEGSDGTIGGADSQLVNDIKVNAEVVESKWAYNSTLMLAGKYYKSGFGLESSIHTSGSGTQIDPYTSEFWIDASKFKFTNSAKTGSKAPFTIDASGSTPQVTFNGIVSFSNVSNTQGSGTNLLYNSAPKIGNETKGWSIGWSNHGLSSSLNAGFDPWRPTGGASVYVVVPGNPGIGTVFDINNSQFPVIANTRYEASAYVSAHRCTSWVTLAWFDSNGNYISENTGSTVSGASSGPLANWGRTTLFATVPSNAATARFYVRSSVTSDNPYCFVAYAYAGVASANQTIASNWSEGSSAGVSSSDVVNDINNGQTTTINGGKITTGTLNGNTLVANTEIVSPVLRSADSKFIINLSAGYMVVTT